MDGERVEATNGDLVARWSVIRVVFIGDDDHGPLADVI
jgi:hypothetical protein